MDSTMKPISPQSDEEDDWDTDGFVIPNLMEKESESENSHVREEAAGFDPPKIIKEETIYLGPHGGRPSQGRPEQEQNVPSNRRRLKNKLKDAERRFAGEGRENKVDTLRELVGCSKISPVAAVRPENSKRDWLDPHCHESLFRKHPR